MPLSCGRVCRASCPPVAPQDLHLSTNPPSGPPLPPPEVGVPPGPAPIDSKSGRSTGTHMDSCIDRQTHYAQQDRLHFSTVLDKLAALNCSLSCCPSNSTDLRGSLEEMTFLNLLVEIAFAASRLDIEGPWSDRTFGREVEDAVEAGRGLLDAVRRPMNIALHPTWRPVCKDCCLPSWDESWVLWMQRHFDYSNYSCPELG